MKINLLLLALCLLLIGCVAESLPSAEIAVSATDVAPTALTATALPSTTVIPTATATPMPTDTPIATATFVPTDMPTVTAVPSDTPTPVVTPFATESGLVYLGETLLIDIATEGPGCYVDIAPDVVYAPTGTHFFVLLACIEGDNHAFVFAANGRDKQRITSVWDLVNMDEISWSADGRTILYQRINSCCLAPEDIPADAPTQGIVEYDVESGEKVVIEP